MTPALLKYKEWQSGSGMWYCNDTSKLDGGGAKWWMPARALDLSLTDFILLLKDTYKATVVSYNPTTDYLHYYWNNYADCHKFVLYINRICRNKNFLC